MSHKLRFRVWDKLERVFVHHYKGYQGHYILSLDGKFCNLQNGSGGEEYVVQQFTGFQDKNGKDVYEGDVVKFSYKVDEHGEVEHHVSEIVFEMGAFGDKYDYLFNYLTLPCFQMEVIGNIFENPELLKS